MGYVNSLFIKDSLNIYQACLSLPWSPASEENNSLKLLVIEEVVERPNAPVFTERIGRKIWIVAVHITISYHYLLINRWPQILFYMAKYLIGCWLKLTVHCIYYPLEKKCISYFIYVQQADYDFSTWDHKLIVIQHVTDWSHMKLSHIQLKSW
jgi:hypothetical protein